MCSFLDVKLVDSLGQNKRKEWSGKTKDIESLKSILEKQVKDGEEGYPFENWSKWGGWKNKKLAKGTGFLQNIRQMASGGLQIQTVMRFLVQDQTA